MCIKITFVKSSKGRNFASHCYLKLIKRRYSHVKKNTSSTTSVAAMMNTATSTAHPQHGGLLQQVLLVSLDQSLSAWYRVGLGAPTGCCLAWSLLSLKREGWALALHTGELSLGTQHQHQCSHTLLHPHVGFHVIHQHQRCCSSVVTALL